MDIISRLFFPKDVYKVFTPSSQAKLTFVNRKTAEKNLSDAIRTPGKQIILFGYSGSGKSTLIYRLLKRLKKEYIVTRCEIGTTLEVVLLNAFDSLGPYFVDSRTNKKTGKGIAEVGGSYLAVKGAISSEISEEDGITLKRVLPPQLTPQRLAEYFRASDAIWVIEDFHKIGVNEKNRLSQILKIFMDEGSEGENRGTKVCTIGAVGTARDILTYDEELNNRVAEVEVPLMDNDEIRSVILKGEKHMNVMFSEKVKKRIVNLSNGLPAVCHSLCLNILIQRSIYKTKWFIEEFDINVLDSAVETYVKEKSDTFKSIYDRVTKHNAGALPNAKIILEAMTSFLDDEVSYGELLAKIKETNPNYPQGNLTTYLNKLADPQDFEVLHKNEGANKFSFLNPFFKVYILMRIQNEVSENTANLTLTSKNVINNSTISVTSGGQIHVGDK